MFQFTNIAEYHNQLRSKYTTCTLAVQHYIIQIQEQKHLNAFVQVYEQEALLKAAELDATRAANPHIPLKALHGVVIGIKDVLCYTGHPVTAGSNMLLNYTSIYTATVVQKLLDQDAIIIGHQNCDEFAMGSSNEHSIHGVVLNALDNSKVAGGSSGGSAVAVQAGLCMASLGSDTGGSVRQPADFCGIVGIKPTYGLVSRYGLIAYGSSFDQVGPLTRTITDNALLLSVIAGADAYDTTTIPTPLSPKPEAHTGKNICYLKQVIHNEALDTERKQAFDITCDKLTKQGYIITGIEFPLLSSLVPTYYILTTAEASSNLNRYDGVKYGYRTQDRYNDLTQFYKLNRSQGFGNEVKKRIMLGTFVLSAGYYDAYFTKAQQVRQLLKQAVDAIFTQYNYMLMPTAPTTAPYIGSNAANPMAAYLADVYTVLANLTGIPALAVPTHTHTNGMPIGIQVMAPALHDYHLYTVAADIQAT